MVSVGDGAGVIPGTDTTGKVDTAGSVGELMPGLVGSELKDGPPVGANDPFRAAITTTVDCT